MQIRGLTNSFFPPQSFSHYFEQKWVKIALLIGGVFITHAVYSYLSRAGNNGNNRTFQPTRGSGSIPPDLQPPTSSSNGARPLSAGSTDNLNSAASSATPRHSNYPFPTSFFLKTLIGETIVIEAKPEHTLLEFITAINQKLSEMQNHHTSYFDFKIIATGKQLNTPATEYLTMGELNERYKLYGMACLHLISRIRVPEDTITLYSILSSEHARFGKICFFDDQLTKVEEQAIALQNFQVAVHSYCDRIMRKKFTTTDESELKQLKDVFSVIIQDAQGKSRHVENYLNYLLDKVSIASIVFQNSFADLLKNLEEKMYTLPRPGPTIMTGFVVNLEGKPYYFDSLERLAHLSHYFNAFKEMQTSPTVECTINVDNNRDIQFIQSLEVALLYLQAKGSINDVNAYETLKAANFLQIPRLVLVCERALIIAIKNNQIDFKATDFTVDDLKLLQLVAPYFYRALQIKGIIQK